MRPRRKRMRIIIMIMIRIRINGASCVCLSRCTRRTSCFRRGARWWYSPPLPARPNIMDTPRYARTWERGVCGCDRIRESTRALAFTSLKLHARKGLETHTSNAANRLETRKRNEKGKTPAHHRVSADYPNYRTPNWNFPCLRVANVNSASISSRRCAKSKHGNQQVWRRTLPTFFRLRLVTHRGP